MPDLRITEERLRHYVQMLQEQGLASVTLVSRATDLQQALRVMNKGANLNLLSKLISSLQMRAVPSRNKHVRIQGALGDLNRGTGLHGVSDWIFATGSYFRSCALQRRAYARLLCNAAHSKEELREHRAWPSYGVEQGKVVLRLQRE